MKQNICAIQEAFAAVAAESPDPGRLQHYAGYLVDELVKQLIDQVCSKILTERSRG